MVCVAACASMYLSTMAAEQVAREGTQHDACRDVAQLAACRGTARGLAGHGSCTEGSPCQPAWAATQPEKPPAAYMQLISMSRKQHTTVTLLRTLRLRVWLHRLNVRAAGGAVARPLDAAATEAVAAAGQHAIVVKRPARGVCGLKGCARADQAGREQLSGEQLARTQAGTTCVTKQPTVPAPQPIRSLAQHAVELPQLGLPAAAKAQGAGGGRRIALLLLGLRRRLRCVCCTGHGGSGGKRDASCPRQEGAARLCRRCLLSSWASGAGGGRGWWRRALLVGLGGGCAARVAGACRWRRRRRSPRGCGGHSGSLGPQVAEGTRHGRSTRRCSCAEGDLQTTVAPRAYRQRRSSMPDDNGHCRSGLGVPSLKESRPAV